MSRLLIVAGLVLVAIGLVMKLGLPLGRLPGDIVVDRPGFKVYAPFTTMLILSLVISALIWLFRR